MDLRDRARDLRNPVDLGRRLRHRARLEVAGFRARNDVQAVVTARNDWLFHDLGVHRADADERWKVLLAGLGHDDLPWGSAHYLVFAALALSGFRPEHVIELGTFRGEATQFLSAAFPDSTIWTVDLPEDDPAMEGYNVSSAEVRADADRRLAGRSNVRRVAANTFFLPELGLPEPDLVWLDAGHFFPEVAWDHFRCLSKLRPGGWLLSDDVRLPRDRERRPGAFDAHRVIAYWNQRRTDQFRFLLKREDKVQVRLAPQYIAVLHLSADERGVASS